MLLLNLNRIRTAQDRIEQVHQPDQFAPDEDYRVVAPAAFQLQGGLHPPGEPERLLVLEDVERQRDRCDDAKVLVRLELVRLMDLLDPVLRRPDLVQTQREHGTSQYTLEKGWRQP